MRVGDMRYHFTWDMHSNALEVAFVSMIQRCNESRYPYIVAVVFVGADWRVGDG